MDKYEKSHLNPCFPFDNLSFSFVDVCHTVSWCWSISADFAIPYETEATKAKLLKKINISQQISNNYNSKEQFNLTGWPKIS